MLAIRLAALFTVFSLHHVCDIVYSAPRSECFFLVGALNIGLVAEASAPMAPDPLYSLLL